MSLTRANLKYVQSALPADGEVVEDVVERLHKVFKRAAGKAFPGIEVRHDIIREKGFNGSL
jgi:hypothetical protein